MIEETKNQGIQKKIIKMMLIIGIFPLVAGLYLTYLDVTKSLRNSIGMSFQDEATATARKVEMVIEREVVDAERFAISPYIKNAITGKNPSENELSEYIRKFKQFSEKEVYSLMVVDSRANFVAGIRDAHDNNYRDEKWFNVAYDNGAGRVYVGDLKLDEQSGKYLMNISAPVNERGKTIGVVVIKYTMNDLLEVINNVRIGATGHANLVDSTGTIIMCPIYPLRSHHLNAELINMVSRTKPGWNVADDDAHGGKYSIVGFSPVNTTLYPEKGWFDGNRWFVFVRQSPGEMYAPIISLLIRVSIFGSVLIIFLSLTGVYAARNIVKPIDELYKGVEEFGQGNLDYRMNIRTNDEIEKLADGFNNMADDLKKTYTDLEVRNKELETSEERYKDLVEYSPEMIHSVNAERYFINVNKTELDILGYSIEEMRNKRLEDIVPDAFKERVRKHIEKVIKEGMSRIEAQFITKGIGNIDVELSATAFYHPVTKQFIKTRAFVRDITDRKRLETHLKEYHELLEQKVSERTMELKEMKDYLENLLETANDVIYTLNPDGIITYVNKQVEDWGYKKDDLIGVSFISILTRQHQGNKFKHAITAGIKHTYEMEITDKFGEVKYVVMSISPLRGEEGRVVGVLGIANDITERKRLEQQVAQAEKMSAIGQLAAGIAHEVNNPIGGIMNCLYNLRRHKLSKERQAEYLKSMEDGIYRVQRTVDQLLDFSQQHQPELTAVDINTLLDEVLSLMSYAISKNGITLRKELDSGLPRLMIDHHKMGQVVMNILLNAVQAIKGTGGQLSVSTYEEDGWCCIDITDNGAGIPPHVLPKIFDPFFTTKDVGKGTGLGLAVSLGIVEKHSGKIDVKSTEGKGTTFTIRLPLTTPTMIGAPLPVSLT
ncbi:MAG: PAS domain S-box protein [Nitrospirae bacterium]|nr:PAS domain S-box protein [Nitrospirota bacterium]